MNSNVKMLPFDFEKVKQGHPVCTKDGRDVRILCTDVKSIYPIAAIIIGKDSSENVFTYNSLGEIHDGNSTSGDNLMLLATKHEGWMNIYRYETVIQNSAIYNTKEECEELKNCYIGKYIDTIKVEWYE